MNKLVATWHQPVDIDLDRGLDVAELLTRARQQLVDVPELVGARRLVEAALAEVAGWFDRREDDPVVTSVGASARR